MMLDFAIFAAAAVGPENPVSSIAREFGVTGQLFFSQLVAFCVVAWALNKFAYKPVLEVLETRKQKIAEGLENADKIKSELAKAEQSRIDILEKANTQATGMIEEARAAAAQVKEVETQKAVAEAKSIIEKAREANSAELAHMKAELRGEIVRLVADTTAKVAGRVLTEDDQKRLAEETNSQLAA
ncbi:MAG: F0F1 ATP synthase subunit B [Verrucomicrobiia bacterium]|jgi:F-type H+-transporting ATPase subunit b